MKQPVTVYLTSSNKKATIMQPRISDYQDYKNFVAPTPNLLENPVSNCCGAPAAENTEDWKSMTALCGECFEGCELVQEAE